MTFVKTGALLVSMATASCTPAAAQSRLVWDTVVSSALQGNLLGDSPARSVIVYLPPSYDAQPDRRYPVVYFLHGNRSHNRNFTNGTYGGFRLQLVLDSLIRAGAARELVVVLPDAYNRYQGSHYTNSSVTGNWADFIARDLVRHVDRKYRTLARVESRGLAGYSMGGRATWHIARSMPGIFSAIYTLSAGRLAFEMTNVFPDDDWRATLRLRDLASANEASMRVLSYAAAFSPNPARPPFYVDLPFRLVGRRLEKVDAVWNKWLANDPVVLAGNHAANLRRLKAIRFDCGTSDFLIGPNRLLARTLRQHGVRYTFEEYQGDHTNRIGDRLRTRVFAYFSDVLRFE